MIRPNLASLLLACALGAALWSPYALSQPAPSLQGKVQQGGYCQDQSECVRGLTCSAYFCEDFKAYEKARAAEAKQSDDKTKAEKKSPKPGSCDRIFVRADSLVVVRGSGEATTYDKTTAGRTNIGNGMVLSTSGTLQLGQSSSGPAGPVVFIAISYLTPEYATRLQGINKQAVKGKVLKWVKPFRSDEDFDEDSIRKAAFICNFDPTDTDEQLGKVVLVGK